MEDTGSKLISAVFHLGILIDTTPEHSIVRRAAKQAQAIIAPLLAAEEKQEVERQLENYHREIEE